MSQAVSKSTEALGPRRLSFLVDDASYRWLASESERTGISIEKIASAVMRRACDSGIPVGAPGETSKNSAA